MNFKYRDGERVRLTRAVIADETVILPGDLVTLTAGLITKAVAASTKVAFCPDGHAAGDGTAVEVTIGNDFTLLGTPDANFAAANRGAEVDINTTGQTIDLGGSATDVLLVDISEDAGEVGATSAVTVRINKPLF